MRKRCMGAYSHLRSCLANEDGVQGSESLQRPADFFFFLVYHMPVKDMYLDRLVKRLEMGVYLGHLIMQEASQAQQDVALCTV